MMPRSEPRRLVARFESAGARGRLVVDLYEPDAAGLSPEERLVLGLLWDADGLREHRIAERLHLPPSFADAALGALQRKALVERDGDGDTADVWLTAEGRRARALAPDDAASFVARA